MCGILALLDRTGPVAEAAALAALAGMAHRGPDGDGSRIDWDGRLFLGHRRLGIFDPGAGGHQPMPDPETGNWLIFNGAIYNYLELRVELEAAGHRFTSHSDTEVLLIAWRHWGSSALQRFNGMWAFVLFDAKDDKLYVSRDRLGVKPLFWADTGKAVVFGSECTALAQAADVPLIPDPVAVHDFLTLGLTDHRSNSFFQGVLCLPPGSIWSVDRAGNISRNRFHDWSTTPAPATPLKDLIVDATALRLRADVPSGLLLSGGLDSTIVAWAAGQGDSGKPDQILTYGYREKGPHDETDRAERTARYLGLSERLARVAVDPTPSRALLDDVIAHQQQPFNTPSIVASFRLYREMRAHNCTVALTGEGADELFAGYTRRYIPLALRDALKRGEFLSAWKLLRSPHGRLLARRLIWEAPTAAIRWIMRKRRPHIRSIAGRFWHDGRHWFAERVSKQRLPLDAALQADPVTDLLPQPLRYADANGMASGVEVRSPFLDWRVVATALALAPTEKVSYQGGKQILRKLFTGDLPPEIISAPKSHGLGMAEQFAVGAIDLSDLFDHPPIIASDFLDLSQLKAEIAVHPNDPTLWWPVCLLLWLRWLERETAR
ncbi:asparagine synthase (glutamine-hydrolyzing) [Lacibacterium aquatile]|uniref:asparagine synthase (glutamine-hydrolyzing) n=1 Tax=Lacibacterium aquatile TaxID=1168082 RepID=A0ABW5DZ51_9PROT